MIEKLNKFGDWYCDHFIFLLGTIAIADLLYLVEDHLRRSKREQY